VTVKAAVLQAGVPAGFVVFVAIGDEETDVDDDADESLSVGDAASVVAEVAAAAVVDGVVFGFDALVHPAVTARPSARTAASRRFICTGAT
jgi:hypothetical protein